MVFGGSGASRTLTITPAPGQSGNVTINVTVNDGMAMTSASFVLAISGAPNTPPWISQIPDQLISKNTSSVPISFSIGDGETAANNLLVSAVSSKPELLGTTNIIISGDGNYRNITLAPTTDKIGEALVTVTVSDGQASASKTFMVDVTGVSKVALRKNGQGSLYPSLSGRKYSVTAVAAAGQVFSAWSGSVTSTLPTLTLIVQTNMILEANFVPFTIITNGRGSISPNIAGMRNLVVGRSYAITAVRAAGYEFAGWSGSINSLSTTLRFVMQTNMTITANFVPSPFIGLNGRYTGLFYEPTKVDHSSSGSLGLLLTKRGFYSGRLLMGSTPYQFDGRFNLAGMATNFITRLGKTPLTLEMRLGFGDEADQITGRIIEESWNAGLTSDRVTFNSLTNPAAFVGRYTLVIPGTPDIMGDGYGRVLLSSNGTALVTGRLGDGSVFTRTTYVSKQGMWPIYLPLYHGKGSLLSWLIMADRTGDDINGMASWIKPQLPAERYYPAGFTNETEIIGSTYKRPSGATNQVLDLIPTTVAFSGGELAEDFANSVALGSFSDGNQSQRQ